MFKMSKIVNQNSILKSKHKTVTKMKEIMREKNGKKENKKH
jgi:hypothetical protein